MNTYMTGSRFRFSFSITLVLWTKVASALEVLIFTLFLKIFSILFAIQNREEAMKQRKTEKSEAVDSDEEGFPENFEEMVTVDATGIFEDEVDEVK